MTDALKQARDYTYAERINNRLEPGTGGTPRADCVAIAAEADAEIEALRKDAARYRKIRNIAVHGPFECQNYEYGWLEVSGQHEPGFDSAVDAAMENTK